MSFSPSVRACSGNFEAVLAATPLIAIFGFFGLEHVADLIWGEMILSLGLVVVVLGVALVPVGAAPDKSTCLKSNIDCIYSSECCSGCCSESKCVEYADSCQSDLAKLGAGKGGPCANLDPPCKPSYTCILQQPQCPRAPCKPVPTCVPPDYHDYD